MGVPRSGRYLVSAVALLLLGAVAADVARRALRRDEPAAAAAPSAVSRSEPVAPGSPTAVAAIPPPARRGDSGTGRLDLAARMAALQRIAIGGEGTYLAAMLAEGDSVLHRWADERADRPLLVMVRPGSVPGFAAGDGAAVWTAVAQWNGIGLPLRLEAAPDSARADIVVSWRPQLDSNRTGRTDVTWQSQGKIVHAEITLATHLPGGDSVVPAQMTSLALHELGHALGLNHSPERSDVMYHETSAAALTLRDRRTALLLYTLPPGDLK